MPEFHEILASRHTAEFSQAMQHALESLGIDKFPLQACTGQGGQVADGSLSVTVNRVIDQGATIEVQFDVFFTEVIGGCSCADDPYEQPAYGELQLVIDALTGSGDISVRAN